MGASGRDDGTPAMMRLSVRLAGIAAALRVHTMS